MTAEEKQRLKKVGKVGAGLLCAGLLYALIFVPAGLIVPCPFHLLTGLNCPGCGVTRMCVALLHGDFAAAYAVNRGLFLALPAVLGLLAAALYRYILGARAKPWTEKAEKWGSAVLVVYFVIWGIVRNRYGI